jgi:type I restriction enzyme, S subunit
MQGNYPAHWAVKRLSEIATRVNRTGATSDAPLMTISAKNGFMLQSDKYSRVMAGKSAERYVLLKSGEFAYNKGNSLTSPQGCVFPLKENSAKVPFVYYCFDLKDETYRPFAEHAFRAGVLNRELARVINSGVRNDGLLNLYLDDFFACRIALPPIEEQQAIAEILTSVQKAIAHTEELISQLADTKRATMRELLTLGMQRKNAKLVPLPEKWILGRIAEGVTHIPKDWKLVRLVSVAKLQSGHTPDRKEENYWRGNIPWISLQDADALRRLQITATAETIGPEGLKNSSARMLPAGTVVLQRTANVGLTSIMGREMCTSQHFINWICGDQLIPKYLLQVFRHMSREWQRLVAGSVLPDIYMDTFKVLQILLPPIEEQKKIAEFGCSLDRKIELEEEALVTLKATRDALAQELLSGRLRLPKGMIARFENKSGRAA